MNAKANLLRVIIWIALVISNVLNGQNSITWSDCFLNNCESLKDLDLKFGYLDVPENYSDPSSELIKVAFVIIKSTEGNPKRDPLLIFQGGFGMPILELTEGYARNFPIKDRDVILFDYRGSGYSTPELCPTLGTAIWELLRDDLPLSQLDREITKLAENCIAELQQNQLDPNFYGTDTKTRDALRLLEALGFEEVNLYGVSNGTYSIQNFLLNAHDHPIKIRTILSDSNVPSWIATNGTMAIYYRKSLEQILGACSQNANCEAAFPNLLGRWNQFLENLAHRPLFFEGGEEMVLNYYEINAIIHQLLYDSRNYKHIPVLLETLMERDIRFFQNLYPRFKNQVEDINGTSLVNYTYDRKLGRTGSLSLKTRETNEFPNNQLFDLFWDYYTIDTLFTGNSNDTLSFESSIPTLLLAGEFDPVTPPEWSAKMQERYINSHYFVLPKIGHGAITSPCGMNLYKQFLANPNTKITTSCLDTLKTNSINFTTHYYANPNMASLATGMMTINPWLIALILLPIIILLVLLVKSIIGLRKRKGINWFWLLASLLSLSFVALIVHFILATYSRGGLLLALGLVPDARILPVVGAIILVTTLIFFFYLMTKGKEYRWNWFGLFALVCLSAVILVYQIHPFVY
jgi:pimeloyl-ACP methyl ester carboxylesterase